MARAKRKSHFKTRRRRGSYLGVTGKYPSAKSGHSLFFESLRERDLFALLSFDPTVEMIEDHPLTIEYSDGRRKRRYKPDALVTYRATSGQAPRKRLIEVKMADQLERSAEEFKAPFEAARTYASAHDMTFEVVTEVLLPRPRVSNLKFLYPFRLFPVEPKIASAILEALVDSYSLADLCSLLELKGFATCDVIAQTWRLVALQEVAVELDFPLSTDSILEGRSWAVSL